MVVVIKDLPASVKGLLKDLVEGQNGVLGLLADWLQDNPEHAGPVLQAVARLSEWCDYDPDPGDDRFGSTEFVVDGTSCERLDLWRRWQGAVDWQHDYNGVCLTLGRVGTRSVVANFIWDVINGRRVLWCEMLSEVSDHAMLDRWLLRHCYPMLVDGVAARCDAMNFHLCLSSSGAGNRRCGGEPGIVTVPEE